jgi:hypothetical protein
LGVRSDSPGLQQAVKADCRSCALPSAIPASSDLMSVEGLVHSRTQWHSSLRVRIVHAVSAVPRGVSLVQACRIHRARQVFIHATEVAWLLLSRIKDRAWFWARWKLWVQHHIQGRQPVPGGAGHLFRSATTDSVRGSLVLTRCSIWVYECGMFTRASLPTLSPIAVPMWFEGDLPLELMM